MAKRKRKEPPAWPAWWEWEPEIGPHVEKRMLDRNFTEIDLRTMLAKAGTTVRMSSRADGYLKQNTGAQTERWLWNRIWNSI
jgi:hypothetical protein